MDNEWTHLECWSKKQKHKTQDLQKIWVCILIKLYLLKQKAEARNPGSPKDLSMYIDKALFAEAKSRSTKPRISKRFLSMYIDKALFDEAKSRSTKPRISKRFLSMYIDKALFHTTQSYSYAKFGICVYIFTPSHEMDSNWCSFCRSLIEQSCRRVLVFRNGQGTEGVEIVADPERFEDVSHICQFAIYCISWNYSQHEMFPVFTVKTNQWNSFAVKMDFII